ncbi:MAG: pantothenate kinase, partial [Muribaculaceae bacterium]|nr:pantothenate kinase [Muribaculaceae bacterium]
MAITIGIDVGGSTTKIIGLQNRNVISPMCITAADPVSSLFGAFGRYLHDNDISLSDIEQVMITGVGSKSLHTSIYGLPTQEVDEFIADGL